ncbi:MAG: hypothetical protein LBH07_04730, partial [Treponema sp.]|nr:hypothetical protein [Treponema sp.]
MFKSNKSTKLFLIFLVAMFLFSDILTFAQSIDVNTTYNPESNEIINTRFENIQFIINTFLGSIAIIFAGLGLILWRKQLRGGDLYTYTKEALFELKKLLNFIEEFRYVFINENQENKIWLDIQNQYSIYESKIILLDILSNNKINDRINGKNIKDYLT